MDQELMAIYGTDSEYITKFNGTSDGWKWLGTSDGRKWLGTSDGRKWLGTSDGREWLGTSDGRKWLGTSYGREWLGTSDGWKWLGTSYGERWKKISEMIPEKSGIYSIMDEDFRSGARCHDQSTFGPDSPPNNICNTAMCVAGHTVHICGKQGYKLLAELDGSFALAARLIHFKNYPNTPPPNYGSIPDEYARAYVAKRAEEEKFKQ